MTRPSAADANAVTPTPAQSWMNLSDSERLQVVRDVVKESVAATKVDIHAARADGEVILSFVQPVGAGERGGLLLDLELLLKQTVDPSLNVWLEALGDKNSLRNLRGIEVKK